MGFGICGPASCSEEVLIMMVDTALLQINVKNVTVQMIPHTCQTDASPNYRPEDIVVLYVLFSQTFYAKYLNKRFNTFCLFVMALAHFSG
jgi:hypothetical protein